VDNKRLTWTVSSAPGSERAVRLRIDPDATRSIRILEFTYAIGPASHQGGSWLLTLAPPRWPADAVLPAARWQIGFADGRAALALNSSAEFAQLWTWDRGLLRSQPSWTSTMLSRWFVGDARFGDLDVSGEDTTLVAVAASDEPIRFLAIPRSVAWITASLCAIAVGLGLLTLQRRPRALLAACCLLAIVSLVLVAEQAAGVFLTYAQPGMLMLIPVSITRLVLRKRHNQHAAFLPRGMRPERRYFANGSGAHGARGRRKEPTTVDAPAT
jgi:hypothetical protein